MGNYDSLAPTSARSDHVPMGHQEYPLEYNKVMGKDSIDWEEKAEQGRQALYPDSREKYAGELGVSPESLRRLGMGFDTHAYTFPMRRADGSVCGIRTRPLKGDKFTMVGGKLGLFIPEGVGPGHNIMICEGESDTAAALTMGLGAIGTPGAGQARPEVVDFFRGTKASLPCIIGDNGGPGRDGAEKIAEALLLAGIPCHVLYPPEEFNDLRDWMVRGDLTGAALRAKIDYTLPRYPEGWAGGFAQIPNAIFKNGIAAEIGKTAMLLLLAIKSFEGGDGKLFPSRPTLAGMVDVSESTIDRQKTRLRESGLLTWNRGRTRRANEYTVHLDPYCKKLIEEKIKKKRKDLDADLRSGDNRHHAKKEDHD
jgi:hypothetical protein